MKKSRSSHIGLLFPFIASIRWAKYHPLPLVGLSHPFSRSPDLPLLATVLQIPGMREGSFPSFFLNLHLRICLLILEREEEREREREREIYVKEKHRGDWGSSGLTGDPNHNLLVVGQHSNQLSHPARALSVIFCRPSSLTYIFCFEPRGNVCCQLYLQSELFLCVPCHFHHIVFLSSASRSPGATSLLPFTNVCLRPAVPDDGDMTAADRQKGCYRQC